MPISVLAQSSIRSGSPETEASAETVTINPDANGVFPHELLGSITIGEVKEVAGGATVDFRFENSGKYDAWIVGDSTNSLYLQALSQAVFLAKGNRQNLPLEFPQSVTLTDVFLRIGNPAIELSIMKKPASPDGPWQKLSDIQLSYTLNLE